MEIKITKKDVIWSYIANFFKIGSGFLVLPLVLHMLSTEEIAMNYIMLTIGSMIALLDFGFAPQLSRNLTYVFSGVDSICKEGINSSKSNEINYHLLKSVLQAAKRIYRNISFLALLILLTAGTCYIYYFTKGFSNIEHSLEIWLFYSVAVYFNIYFLDFDAFLNGRGYVTESKQSAMASRIVYLVLCYTLLLLDFGLIGLVISNIVSPFVRRYLSYHFYYDKNIKRHLKEEKVEKEEEREIIKTLWYNAKRMGANLIGAYAILQFSLFISGLYLSSSEIDSYGMMINVCSILSSMGYTFFSASNIKMASCRAQGEMDKACRIFSLSLIIFFVVFVTGGLAILLIMPSVLDLIQSNAQLPPRNIVLIYLIVLLLEGNHSMSATAITTGNKVPFVKASLLTGASICLLDFFVLTFTNLGILGLVLAQGVGQLAYNNWRWPLWVCNDFNIRYIILLKQGIGELVNIIKGKLI